MSTDTAGPSDGGFSLIEVGVAGLLLAIFVAVLGGSLSAASNNVVDNRTREQAMAVLTAEIESIRALDDWDDIAMSSVDPAAPMLNAGATALLGSEAGLPTDEILFTDAAGLVGPSALHSSEGFTYTAWRYVTDAGGGLRRVVVLVAWDVEGRQRTVQSSTLVSEFSTDD